MSRESKYSLRELAKVTGVEPRTIRWYIAEGLLKGPESLGPKAYYTEQHRKRIETVRQLKEIYGLSISEIRRYVTMAGDEDIVIVPVRTMHSHNRPDRAQQPSTPDLSVGENEYELFQEAIKSDDLGWGSTERMAPYARRARWLARRAAFHAPSLDAALPSLESRLAGPQSPLVKLLDLLKRSMGERRIHRQARGSNWLEIEVTPDIVLRLRGEFNAQQADLLERLADHLRAYILGGGETPPEGDVPQRQEGGQA